ncbi:ABC transporter ATP-binding protein [Glaciimonas sp. CA11.2]|uniref:ABC transporter ATP-binding protein n=1 Tax=unclassified Glaciimonas TaxID=2644401 RepID=UPI002AB475D6|nr:MULTISPECIES: ABC transporter ATP-binding protein [unclassified Glaciimonas]MDY7545286.1 ABC transporter ATP-binding protein [Glaciimonas sp. CA11.2]MEB0013843.1 ABC transporter ATP-binding protein [Glaciimonas sp. Cout2]MEB0083054.1 ABC transporter ATP-binding protein [Glaciimonas sp. Gout2]MEB0162438.1 ABC transporter ATP-binding protein [Glaciimonas sp. CA11.2]
MEIMLNVDNLSVAYARKGLALDSVSLALPAGSIVALLGANGAGKTTLIRAITGLLGLHGGGVTAGRIDFAGNSILGLPSHQLVRLGMAQVPEGRLVFKQLSVEENLQVGAAILPRAAVSKRMEAVYTLFPRLLERRRQAAGWLSGGEQQMLALGRALVAGPRLLLVDELSLGLAPLIVETIYEQLKVVGDTLGTSMLVVEQNARLALQFASTAYVLDRGRIVLSGPASEVAASALVKQSYLGSQREEATV